MHEGRYFAPWPSLFEAATIECKTRDINMPEVREALDLLAPYCRPEWRVTGFREHLKALEEFGPGREASNRIRYRKTKATAVKADLDRLSAELERMPERWDFVARR